MLDAAMSVWEPYLKTILRALDLMPMGVDIDRSLLVRVTAVLRPLNSFRRQNAETMQGRQAVTKSGETRA